MHRKILRYRFYRLFRSLLRNLFFGRWWGSGAEEVCQVRAPCFLPFRFSFMWPGCKGKTICSTTLPRRLWTAPIQCLRGRRQHSKCCASSKFYSLHLCCFSILKYSSAYERLLSIFQSGANYFDLFYCWVLKRRLQSLTSPHVAYRPTCVRD